MPDILDFARLYPLIPQKKPKQLRVVSANVNGLRSTTKKGFLLWLKSFDADIVCIQESRINHEQWGEAFKIDGWHCHLFAAQKKGYAGTAIYSRLPFISIKDGLGFALCDDEGRFCMGEFLYEGKTFFVGSLYLPSGSSGDVAQARKDAFLLEYAPILQNFINENRSLIICGDYNIVHKKIDIKNWSGNKNSSGCLPHERAWLDDLAQMGYIDTFRQARKEEFLYSWWSNRGKARQNNVGWRIDYQLASKDWQNKVAGAWVYRDVWFSDHAPVVVDYHI